jgi:hypothetical protein
MVRRSLFLGLILTRKWYCGVVFALFWVLHKVSQAVKEAQGTPPLALERHVPHLSPSSTSNL